MKVTHYSVCNPIHGLCKQSAIWGREKSTTSPLVYLQRPKWIKDDDVWRKIVSSIKIMLPKNFEVK